MLVLCFTISCSSRYSPPYKVTGIYKSEEYQSCKLYLIDNYNHEFQTYLSSDYCNYKVGDVIK